jgi:hypothetical protein
MPITFRKEPPPELVLRILAAFGLKSLSDASWFSKSHIRMEMLEACLVDLEPYYMPCKAEIYIYKEMNERRAITILRHILKANNIHLSSVEKARGGVKVIWYQIIPKSNDHSDSIGLVEFNSTSSF